MPSVFPLDPEINDTYQGYYWDGEFWKKQGIDLTENYLEESSASAIYLAKVSASNTYLTQTSASSTYATKTYADSAVASLVDSAPSTLNTLNELAAALGDDANFATTITNALSPIGSVTAYALATPPAGWLLCDGSIYSASAYPTLSVGLGSTYGGNGTTTFAVPNLKGRIPVGLDSSQTEFDTRGETGGAKTHTLTSAEIPEHSHPNALTSNTVASSTHRHDFTFALLDTNYDAQGPNAAMGTSGMAGAYRYSTGSYTGGGFDGNQFASTATNQDGPAALTVGRYTTTGDTNTPSASTTVGITNNNNTGGGGAHNNLQPYIVMNYIIRAA